MTPQARFRFRRRQYALRAAWGRTALVQAWRRRGRRPIAPGTDPGHGDGAGDREPRHPRPQSPAGSAELKPGA